MVRLLRAGKGTGTIAATLGIEKSTVRVLVSRALRKLGRENRYNLPPV